MIQAASDSGLDSVIQGASDWDWDCLTASAACSAEGSAASALRWGPGQDPTMATGTAKASGLRLRLDGATSKGSGPE